MGAKLSASGASGSQSPRQRTFSSSSSSDVVQGQVAQHNHQSTSFLRTMEVNDGRQRTRSLTSVPDLHSNQGAASSGIHYYQDIAEDPGDENSVAPNAIHAAVSALGLGRVYTATSLPSQIWSLNGKFKTSYFAFSLILVTRGRDNYFSHNLNNTAINILNIFSYKTDFKVKVFHLKSTPLLLSILHLPISHNIFLCACLPCKSSFNFPNARIVADDQLLGVFVALENEQKIILNCINNKKHSRETHWALSTG